MLLGHLYTFKRLNIDFFIIRRLVPGIKGLGYAMLLANGINMLMYSVLVSWAFMYIAEVKMLSLRWILDT